MVQPAENTVSHSDAPPEQHSAAIRKVEVLTTGWAEQHKEHRYGTWMPRLLWALTSQSWVELPINMFLIHHKDGPVLFDTGLDPAIASDPSYISQVIGRILVRRIFRFHIGERDGLKHQLQSAGVRPSDIRKAVISHLHFDHVGGVADIPNAELLVSAREWAQLSEPHPEREWILREHIELQGANWKPIAFEATDDPVLQPFGGVYDVMGDGTMMLIPTPGHTPGSLSMLIQSQEMPPILLIGDLAYDPELIFEDRVPGTGNKTQLWETYAKVRALKASLPDLVILTSHKKSELTVEGAK